MQRAAAAHARGGRASQLTDTRGKRQRHDGFRSMRQTDRYRTAYASGLRDAGSFP